MKSHDKEKKEERGARGRKGEGEGGGRREEKYRFLDGCSRKRNEQYQSSSCGL